MVMTAICLLFGRFFMVQKMPNHDKIQATLTVIVISVKGVSFLFM